MVSHGDFRHISGKSVHKNGEIANFSDALKFKNDAEDSKIEV